MALLLAGQHRPVRACKFLYPPSRHPCGWVKLLVGISELQGGFFPAGGVCVEQGECPS